MTEIIRLTKSLDYNALGPWWRGLHDEPFSKYPIRTAWVRCPNNHYSGLQNHEIADDGTVTPSVVCSDKSHSWHVFLILEGWES